MPKRLNRRDFLKLASLSAGSLLVSSLAPRALNVHAQTDQSLPNIIIFVFDAMSARNLALYGYPRSNTPNLQKFAERATVYHAHHAAGNYTVPGTASLLTGMYPWTHRAINQAGIIVRSLAGRNLFTLLGSRYQRIAYSQNMWPNYLFEQFSQDIDWLLPPGAFSAVEQIVGARFPKHRGDAYRAYEEFLFQDGNPPASLIFGLLGRLFLRRQAIFANSADYERGLPRAGNYPIYFRLNEVFDGLQATIKQLSSPYFAYFHLWAPHAPYKPAKPFEGMFANDNWKPERKPQHPLGGQVSQSQLNTRRMNYDAYIANLDNEFGRLINALHSQGQLNNTYIIVTSDHGESFERGLDGHITPLLFEPLTHIPLLIAAPGQETRKDIHTPTNCVDILPTLLSLAGQPIPEWCEGQILPGLGGSDDPARSIFSVEAATNPAFAPLQRVSIALQKENFKLTLYKGYQEQDLYELYDLTADPEELTNLLASNPSSPSALNPLKQEILERLSIADAPYRRK